MSSVYSLSEVRKFYYDRGYTPPFFDGFVNARQAVEVRSVRVEGNNSFYSMNQVVLIIEEMNRSGCDLPLQVLEDLEIFKQNRKETEEELEAYTFCDSMGEWCSFFFTR